MFCKYFLLRCGLPLHSFNSIYQRTDVFNFNNIQLIQNFSWMVFYHVISKKFIMKPKTS